VPLAVRLTGANRNDSQEALALRYDKRADIHEAFLSLGCALICWQSLRKTWRTA
jgi:hypothetical protein